VVRRTRAAGREGSPGHRRDERHPQTGFQQRWWRLRRMHGGRRGPVGPRLMRAAIAAKRRRDQRRRQIQPQLYGCLRTDVPLRRMHGDGIVPVGAVQWVRTDRNDPVTMRPGLVGSFASCSPMHPGPVVTLHRPRHGCGRDWRRGPGCLVGVTGSPVRPRAGPVPVQALCSRCEHMRLHCRGVYPTGRNVQGVNAVNGRIWWSGGLERPGVRDFPGTAEPHGSPVCECGNHSGRCSQDFHACYPTGGCGVDVDTVRQFDGSGRDITT
jgi:hypothetical protein